MVKKLHKIDTMHISEARFIGEDGAVTFVQPSLGDEELRYGRVVYNKDIHYKKLICSHCNIRVDFNKGAGVNSGGANLRGSRPHFSKARNQEHEVTCELPKMVPHKSDSEVNKNIGFRIHLNADFRAPLNNHQPVYKRAEGRKVIANDERLQPALKQKIETDEKGKETVKLIKVYREAVAVHNVSEIIDIMRRGEMDRLKDSLVINNVVLPWKNFAILGENRMRNLVDRLRKGASHPVLLRVALNRPAEGEFAQSKNVFFERTEQGATFIIPRIYMDHERTKGSFPTHGEYLVLGLPKLGFDAKSGAYFLRISLKDDAFVAPYFESKILEEAKAHDEKRKAPAPAALLPV